MKLTITIRVVVGVVIAIFLVEAWLREGRPDLTPSRFFSAAVFVSVAIFNIWDFWLWRLPLVQRIPGVPRSVRGTWKGILTSLWIDPATKTAPPLKTAYLVVRQTASRVTVKLFTDESRSSSALASVSEVDGSWMLTYLYLNKPDMHVEHRSRMHHGSAVFDVTGNPASHLKGRYWTDRDSKGELDFSGRRSSLADDFDEAQSLFEKVT